MLKRIKGQSMVEYALIITIVALALLAVNIYMKRGVEGKLRDSGDSIGQQFEARATEVIVNRDASGTVSEENLAGKTTVTLTGDKSVYSGSEAVEKMW